ncbi:MAG TPA: asparagine synthase (glutamine-hydrolyzing) [Gemmatimonadales bacterium]|nr:asparagine synthase (glutamine-hydrolyzing) [Anaeromyxobacteraceae bacterium]HUK20973.1 asparagine synthase (glutamine-hydrolyzing) [Gemmatimonadales bacterium]
MCGIAGVVSQSPDRLESTRHLIARLNHRGPDEGGEFDRTPCSLAMRRLSIIDVAGGHQPIFNETRRLVCVCNGELYNFQILARQLKDLGHSFATGSDVEVAVHGYESWGDDFVTKINGMFALAIWDADRQRLLLARDRLGKKPLYYAQLGGSLAFASELRSLLAFPGAAWTVDRDACRAFCSLGYFPANRTPILQIRRLAPGHMASWENGSLDIRPYSEPQPTPPPESEAAAANTLMELLLDAVQLRLISDVPLGAFLSGGLDSSVIVAIAAGRLGARIPTFSVAVPGHDYDEAQFARRVARKFGCEHHEISLEPSYFDDLGSLVWALDEPLADPAALPTLLLSRAARAAVTVVLTGEGADEALGGYERYSLALRGSALAGRVRPLGSLAAVALRLRGRRGTDDSRVSRMLRGAATGGSSPIAWSRAVAISVALADDPDWTSVEALLAPPTSVPATNGTNRLLRLQLDDFAAMLSNGLLTKVDRMTMAASLEARCPFLDYRIVNFGLGLPDSWKISGSTNKVVLRNVARRVLPKEISERPKHTFRVPLAEWLRGPLKGLARDAASSALLSALGICSSERARRLADDHASGRADFSRALWALITLHLWLTEASSRVSLGRAE